MGTSAPSSGSNSKTPLVPSWLDDHIMDPLTEDDQTLQLDDSNDGEREPSQPISATKTRFRSARNNFSRFARSGGSDQRALQRAVRDYVRTGTGGTTNTVRRMAPSQKAATQALDLLLSLQRDGLKKTLREIDLQNLSDSSVQDIFIGLTEVICEDGGTIDEAIARDAWLETIAKLDQFGIDDLDTLTILQVQELFLSFVSHSIETRLYQEIGVNGFKLSENLEDIERFDEQFRGYIERTVRDSFSGDISTQLYISRNDITYIVKSTYMEAWDLLQSLGDREG